MVVLKGHLQLIILLALLLIDQDAATAATEKATRCPIQTVLVLHHVDDRSIHLICDAVARTHAFLHSHGWTIEAQYTIRVTDAPLSLHGVEVTGTYDTRTLYITVPSYRQAGVMAGSRMAFGLNMGEALWQSFIAHEAAHAVAHANFFIIRPSLAAHEYIAFITQLALMPDSLRDQVLSRIPNKAFMSEREISNTFLALDPQVFAVKSYRHYLSLDAPEIFLSRLRNGQFRPPDR